jgi:hypothetical protein
VTRDGVNNNNNNNFALLMVVMVVVNVVDHVTLCTQVDKFVYIRQQSIQMQRNYTELLLASVYQRMRREYECFAK